MATFFGEIRPFYSRAIVDEDKDIPSNYKISIETFDGNSNCKTKLMIVSVGEISSVFVKSYFLNKDSSLICSVNYSIENDDDDSLLYTGMQTSKSGKKFLAASVYKSCSDILVCDVSKAVPEELCFEITDMILNNYVPSETLIMTSKHMANFKGEKSTHSSSSFLKSMCNSYYKNSYSCSIPRLIPPNFLTNMAASILLKCETLKIPAACFIAYLDTDAVDYLNVHLFDQILNEAIVSKVPVNADAKAKVIKLVKAKQSTESNLYV